MCKRLRLSQGRGEVRATERVVIPPESSKAINVSAHFPSNFDSLIVERCLKYNSNVDDIYGAADTFISRNKPILHVSNFSKRPVIIAEGAVLGKSHDPRTWLDKSHRFSNLEHNRINAHAHLIRNLAQSSSFTIQSKSEVSSKAQRNANGEDDALSTSPLEGGPKTAEVALDHIPAERLIQEVDISSDLSTEQRVKLERVILKNNNAFGLDGKLGNYDAKVDIQLKPGSKPVSLPPFPCSPANREVIDKQIDSWLQLGVIEPSKSPWGAPVFIVYRNGK
ncbi:hypothetical protein K435DRAFT_658911, partial [Dendrothele bispora CBS 962.96]